MIIDSRTLPQDTEINTDVCIVGAGTSGITLANEMVDQKFNVVLLESGGSKPDRESHALNEGRNIGRPYFSLDTSRARFLGGCCNRWNINIGNGHLGARIRPLDSIDFETREWIPFSGWPFDKAHLDPYYDRAQKICEVTPSSFDPQDWSNTDHLQTMQLRDERVQTVIFKFGPRDPFLNSYLERIKKATNIKTFLFSNVVDIETNESAGIATGVKASCLHGPTFRVKAKIIVLSLGGLETPRLLLLSNKVQPEGLGNGYDLVGRFFMEHPHFRLGYVVPFDKTTINSTELYNRIHLVNNVAVVAKLSLTEETIRKEKLVNFVTQFNPRIVLASRLAQAMYPNIPSKSVKSYKVIKSMLKERKSIPDLFRHFANIVRGMDDVCVSAAHKVKRDIMRHFNKRQVYVYWLENMSEQVPNPDSRVCLSDDLDALGQRRITLNWKLSEIDIESAIRTMQILDDALQVSGIGRLYNELDPFTKPEKITGGWHQMGTTRMHKDPKYGVVDINCCVHGVSNLFIAGPSVFPTAGYANPTLTIVAMTVRLADHIKAKIEG